MLFVLDLNGQLLTKKEFSEEWKQGRDGPRSSVRINDGKLYLYTAFGKLFCLDEATLEEVWRKDILQDFDGQNIPWGLCEYPLIIGEKLFISAGGATNNMIALNKDTGELIWSSPGEGTVSAYCSPLYVDNQSVPMIVTSMAEYIIAWNVATGEKLWSFYRTSEFNNHPNTPLYHNNMIFSSTGDGAPAVMLRLKNGGKDVEQVWKNNEIDTQMGGALRIDENIYTSGHKNRYWYCVDWNTGEIRYKVRDIAACSVVFADGMLYCYTERGTMNLVKPNPDKFELVSSFNVTLGDGTHFAHPVIHNGIMYIRHGDVLMAYKIVEN
jgi:outer membrane protein assembly factor BamB